MKIAITWSNWFVWSYVVKYFSKENEIIAFQRQKDEIVWNIKYIKWDLREKFSKDIDFDIFIHCASDTWYWKTKKEMIENNVFSNKNILELVNKLNCKHFIYISSSSVYQWISWVIDENIIINEKNLTNSYSLTKYLAEQYIINNLNKNIKLTILRPRAIYWSWDRVLEPNILKHKIWNRLLLLWNGKNITSLTSIESLINSIFLVIRNQKNNFEIFNISDEKTKNMEEIYLEISKKYNLSWIIKIPIQIIKTFEFFNKNKISYLIDSFEKEKILNIKKIRWIKD
jgi:nucleoside-diphosphate-sugar epimerase